MDLRHGRWERQRRASCADVERDLIRTRTVEGRSRAKARGQPMGRQKEATRRRAQGATLQELADSYDRSISTMRRATTPA
jgi:DNA invertase Pin-like site-specific DNA recombinase